ncbi:delta-60 repeat domain-containing protein, partial [Dokdonella sp.]|uniref:delta-60 repeat domain-containing protein n=1 Tax=Dokdonella sp. TaxID=2291710 RepID=UPI0031C299F5|nr:delta-60 repeat domain-containing protein [Dokdonella sp.]
LEPNGSLDTTFQDPKLQSWTDSMVLQADGKLLVAGGFNAVDGMPRAGLARINANGSLDTGFADLGADHYIDALTLQADGHLMVGGRYSQIGGTPIKRLARVALAEPAEQTQQVDAAGTRVRWMRAGSSPELGAPPILYRSTDAGATWTTLGAMGRIAGGWEKAGIPPLVDEPYILRAEGLVPGGLGGNSQGRVGTQAEYLFADLLFADGFEEGSRF